MKILLLGATGLAGKAFYSHLKKNNFTVIGVARNNADINIDITDRESLLNILESNSYDAIINSAANINIDFCEKNPCDSWMINAFPVISLANLSAKKRIPFLHISTDHFYDYGEDFAHSENDPITLINNYASQKYAAEAFALTSKYALVLRTSFIGFGSKNNNSLIEWFADSLVHKKKIKLFSDAWTSSLDLDSFIYFTLKLFIEKNARGLINLASRDVFSKEQLLKLIASRLQISDDNFETACIKKVFSKRANCLGLNVLKAQNILNEELPSLDEIVSNLTDSIKKYI